MNHMISDKYLQAKLQLSIAIENLNENIKSCNEIGLNVRIMQMPTGAPANPAPVSPAMPMPTPQMYAAAGWQLNTPVAVPTLESTQFVLQKLYKEF